MIRTTRLLLLALLLALTAAPAAFAETPPSPAEGASPESTPGAEGEGAPVGDAVPEDRPRRERGDRVGFLSPVRVAADEIIGGDVVGIGTKVEVDGVVRGDLVAVGSRLVLRGEVRGDLVGVGSTLKLLPGSKIRGELVNVGGKLDNQGAEVEQTTDLGLRAPFTPSIAQGIPMGFLAFFGLWMDFLVIALVFLVLLLHSAIVPERVRTISEEAPLRPGTAFLAGLLGYAALFVVNFFLIVTLVGIPLAVLVYFVFKVLQWLGFAGICLFVGERLGRLLNREVSLLGGVLLGFLPFALLRFLPFCTGWLIWFVLEIFAIGFVILTRAGGKGSVALSPPPAVAPPAPGSAGAVPGSAGP